MTLLLVGITARQPEGKIVTAQPNGTQRRGNSLQTQVSLVTILQWEERQLFLVPLWVFLSTWKALLASRNTQVKLAWGYMGRPGSYRNGKALINPTIKTEEKMEAFCLLQPHDSVIPLGGAEGLQALIRGGALHSERQGAQSPHPSNPMLRAEIKPNLVLASFLCLCTFFQRWDSTKPASVMLPKADLRTPGSCSLSFTFLNVSFMTPGYPVLFFRGLPFPSLLPYFPLPFQPAFKGLWTKQAIHTLNIWRSLCQQGFTKWLQDPGNCDRPRGWGWGSSEEKTRLLKNLV